MQEGEQWQVSEPVAFSCLEYLITVTEKIRFLFGAGKLDTTFSYLMLYISIYNQKYFPLATIISVN